MPHTARYTCLIPQGIHALCGRHTSITRQDIPALYGNPYSKAYLLYTARYTCFVPQGMHTLYGKLASIFSSNPAVNLKWLDPLSGAEVIDRIRGSGNKGRNPADVTDRCGDMEHTCGTLSPLFCCCLLVA